MTRERVLKGVIGDVIYLKDVIEDIGEKGKKDKKVEIGAENGVKILKFYYFKNKNVLVSFKGHRLENEIL